MNIKHFKILAILLAFILLFSACAGGEVATTPDISPSTGSPDPNALTADSNLHEHIHEAFGITFSLPWGWMPAVGAIGDEAFFGKDLYSSDTEGPLLESQIISEIGITKFEDEKSDFLTSSAKMNEFVKSSADDVEILSTEDSTLIGENCKVIDFSASSLVFDKSIEIHEEVLGRAVLFSYKNDFFGIVFVSLEDHFQEDLGTFEDMLETFAFNY